MSCQMAEIRTSDCFSGGHNIVDYGLGVLECGLDTVEQLGKGQVFGYSCPALMSYCVGGGDVH